MIIICGIFGISYGPDGPQAEEWEPEQLLQILFPATVHRGRHAWGYMAYNGELDERGKRGVEFFKQAGSADHKDAASEMILPNNTLWFVGHVRFSTKGSPQNPNNNHPIIHGDVMGVHNGVLRNDADIFRQTGRERDDTQVDSEAIFAAVNKWGTTKGLAKIHGDMVAVFVNTGEPEKLYLARGSGRPLVMARTKAGSLIWASESNIILDAALELEDKPKEYTGVNRLLTVHQGKILSDEQYRKPVARPAPTKFVSTGYGGTNSGGDLFVKDKFGGTYIGGGMWRVPDDHRPNTTRLLNATKYVEWAVEREVKKRLAGPVVVVPTRKPELSPVVRALPSDENQALSVVSNNGNV